VAFIDLQNTVG